MERPNPYQRENAGVKKSDPQHAPHEGGNGVPGIPTTLNERAKPPPEASISKPRLTPEERAEKKRKYARDYKKKNKDKVNAYQRRYTRHEEPIRPNEKLREYQSQRHLERLAQQQEEKRGEQSAKVPENTLEQHEATQIFPPPPKQ